MKRFLLYMMTAIASTTISSIYDFHILRVLSLYATTNLWIPSFGCLTVDEWTLIAAAGCATHIATTTPCSSLIVQCMLHLLLILNATRSLWETHLLFDVMRSWYRLELLTCTLDRWCIKVIFDIEFGSLKSF